MAKLYRLDVLDSVRSRDGVGTYMQHGDAVVVDGEPMVRLSHGTIVAASNFCATRDGARASAAERVEEFAQALMAQAAALRQPEVQS